MVIILLVAVHLHKINSFTGLWNLFSILIATHFRLASCSSLPLIGQDCFSGLIHSIRLILVSSNRAQFYCQGLVDWRPSSAVYECGFATPNGEYVHGNKSLNQHILSDELRLLDSASNS